MGIFRGLILFIDRCIYWAVGVIFQLIIDLANFNLFTDETITSFSNRVYLIIGIVMVFKLFISFFQMLIDPDKLTDKENGAVGILRRVIISLILIATVRSIFNTAMQLQKRLLPIIPKVILGSKADIGNDGEVINGTGNLMAYYTFTAFFYPYQECSTETNLKGFNNENATIDKVWDITSKDANATCSASPDPDGYTHRYTIFIATLAGAFLVYVLVTIAVKIAIRAIKLSLCLILAPIPIASYIDPKTSKQSFSKWVETSIKTYIDLFTRIIVVYFIIYVFQILFVQVHENGITRYTELVATYGGDYGRASLVALFIIVGLLYFAKEMPKFVTSMLGLPEGLGDIGDMLKGQGWRQLGTTIGGAAGLVSQPFGAAAAAAQHSWMKGERGRAVARTLGAFGAGLGRSSRAFLTNKGLQGTIDARHQTVDNARRHINNSQLRRSAYGKGIKGALNFARHNAADNFFEFIGTPLPTSQSYHEAASLMNRGKTDIFASAKTKISEKPFEVTYNHTWTDASGTHSKTWAQILGAMKEAEAGKEITDIELRSMSREQFEDLYGRAWKSAAAKYIDEVRSATDAKSSKNSNLYNKIDQWKMDYDTRTVIMRTDREEADKKMFDKATGMYKYGDFFMTSDDIGADYETKSKQLADIEQAKKGDSGK